MKSMNDFTKLEKKINVKFKNKNLLKQALVHRSFINENVGFDLDNNERLEFLGDAVLELIVTEYLYKNYKNQEGELTNWRAALVKREMLAKIAKKISIGEYLYLSKGESKTGGQSRGLILANALEALIGAIYIDSGTEVTKKFLEENLLTEMKDILKNKLYIDPKSKLQELSQGTKSLTPKYQVLSEYGPDHNKSFTVGVYLNDKLIGQGSGSSKQAAEQSAASSALEGWQE